MFQSLLFWKRDSKNVPLSIQLHRLVVSILVVLEKGF